MMTAKIAATNSGDTTVVAAVSGRSIKVLSYVLVAAGAVDVKFKSGPTDITGTMSLPGAGYGVSSPAAISSMGYLPQLQTAPGEALVINLSAAVTVGGHLTYSIEG